MITLLFDKIEEIKKEIGRLRRCPYCKRKLTEFTNSNGGRSLRCEYKDCNPEKRIGNNLYTIDVVGEIELKGELKGLTDAKQFIQEFLDELKKYQDLKIKLSKRNKYTTKGEKEVVLASLIDNKMFIDELSKEKFGYCGIINTTKKPFQRAKNN